MDDSEFAEQAAMSQKSVADLQGKLEMVEEANRLLKESTDNLQTDHKERELKLESELESAAAALAEVLLLFMF